MRGGVGCGCARIHFVKGGASRCRGQYVFVYSACTQRNISRGLTMVNGEDVLFALSNIYIAPLPHRLMLNALR